MPSSTDNSHCPRCGGGFHCGAAEARCDCFELKLSAALRAELAQRYSGCLCLNCLRELAKPTEPPGNTSSPS
ncbi:cysteine-rich CWC family protein [Inhella proteolytica]|uniref:Cysteine-rich CWC family protein n=1 Tax=Inhella proteolytica TaxID=2795029 RepID=A0A931NH30_9BURK|nr:cysteine-rich CWC family protein [Inhella proteolytica]MBH9576080.1 cysteine-rich CWC family protein [Inhella proteolytica]